MAVDVREAAVEGREQAPALAVRDRHRPTHGGVGRLVAAGVEGERRPRVVEPGDVGDDPWIVELGAERGDEDGRATVDRRPGRPPDPFARQRACEDGRDPAGPGPRGSVRGPGQADGRKRLQLRAALLRRVPRVVEALGLVDEPVAVMVAEPLDAAHTERQARGLHHRRDVRVDDGRDQDDQGHQRHTPPPEPRRRRGRERRSAAGRRSTHGHGLPRFERAAHLSELWASHVREP